MLGRCLEYYFSIRVSRGSLVGAWAIDRRCFCLSWHHQQQFGKNYWELFVSCRYEFHYSTNRKFLQYLVGWHWITSAADIPATLLSNLRVSLNLQAPLSLASDQLHLLSVLCLLQPALFSLLQVNSCTIHGPELRSWAFIEFRWKSPWLGMCEKAYCSQGSAKTSQWRFDGLSFLLLG